MQKVVVFSAMALAITTWNCSDNGLSPGADMTFTPASVDMAVSMVDMAQPDFSGVTCGNSTCGGSDVCCVELVGGTAVEMCVAQGQCPMNGGVISCDGPEDCSKGGTPNCCINISLQGGGGDAGIQSGNGSAMCTADCPGAVVPDNNGGGAATTKLCHVNDDCKNYIGTAPLIGLVPFNKCCSNPQYSAKSFCAPLAGETVYHLYNCQK